MKAEKCNLSPTVITRATHGGGGGGCALKPAGVADHSAVPPRRQSDAATIQFRTHFVADFDDGGVVVADCRREL